MSISSTSSSSSSLVFRKLVAALRKHKKTVAVVESCCGGLINAGILAQPGASAVYYGGSVAYNTHRAKPLLLNRTALHESLLLNRKKYPISNEQEYIASKVYWTRQTSVAFCHELGVDYCIAEGGAAGPTFPYPDMNRGFAVISIAAASDGAVVSEETDASVMNAQVVRHRLVHSTHGNRQGNMKLFSESAAEIALQVILEREEGASFSSSGYDDEKEAEDRGDGEKITMEPQQPAPPSPSSCSASSTTTTSLVLDRASPLRCKPEKLLQLADASNTHYVALRKNTSLFVKQQQQQQQQASSGSSISSSTNITNDSGFSSATGTSRELAYLTKPQLDDLCQKTGWKAQTSFLGLLHPRHTNIHVDSNTATSDSAAASTTVSYVEQPMFGVDLMGGEEDSKERGEEEDKDAITLISNLLGQDVEWENTRTVAPLLRPLQNEVLLHSTALAEWQRRHKFCSVCGGPTELDLAGSSRRCLACRAPSWPRQDPSMIAAVSSRDGNRILLARSPRHPPRMFTVLAGFVEAGETMEQAVAREVYEETALRIDPHTVRYVASQPWPFPQSTMIGFLAKTDVDFDDENQAIQFDPKELVEAAWFTRDQVEKAARLVPDAPVMQHDVAQQVLEMHPETELLIPPKGVLARRLIEAWLNDK